MKTKNSTAVNATKYKLDEKDGLHITPVNYWNIVGWIVGIISILAVGGYFVNKGM